MGVGGKKFSLERLVRLVIVGIVATTCIAVLSIPQNASAAPPGWDYKRSITLTPATPVADYQVKIELNTSNFDYSKAKSDGGDIRFYDPGNNKLDYWIEEWNITGTSKIWVNVTTSGTGTILMYYGNPSATSESNGDDVFDFFDDFNDGIYTDKWTNPHPQGTYTESGGVIQLYSTGYCSLDSIKQFTGPCVIESRTQRYTGGDYRTYLREVGTNNMVESGISYYGQRFGIRRQGIDFGPEQVLFVGNSSNAWKEFRGLLHGTTWHVYRGDVLDNWDRDDTLSLDASADGRVYYVQIFTHEWGDTGAYWDWVRVRKYASPEPSASVGNETAVGPPVGGTVTPVNKLALLAPWIILAAIITIVTVSVAVYWRRR